MTQRSKSLSALLDGILVDSLRGDRHVQVTGVQVDSRRVRPGDLFVAVEGLQTDGHGFVAQAVARGASAAVVSKPVEVEGRTAVVRVRDTRAALAALAANYWDHPSMDVCLIGVTGTNGKTTLTYLLESVIRAAGGVPGVLGTVNTRYPGHQEDNLHTTPEACDLQRTLAHMRQAGVTHVAMEVSSHALDLQRVRHCHFRSAVFTNLSRDHLDYHGSMDRYARAKSLLFTRELNESRARDKVAVVNLDDARWNDVLAGWGGNLVTFGDRPDADVHPAGSLTERLTGFEARVAYPAGETPITCRLPGRHNLHNALAAFAVAVALGLDATAVARGIAACERVPGRLDRVQEGEGPHVFVDYAHTDQALIHVLRALRPLTPGRLLVVFGCGGDRDRGKRPLMGAAVAKGADLAVVTSDNPRTEDPLEIIQAILPGLDAGGFERVEAGELAAGATRQYVVVPDRREAIALAVDRAAVEDVVVVAGKGHETYQIVGTERNHFDDHQEASEALRKRAGDRGR